MFNIIIMLIFMWDYVDTKLDNFLLILCFQAFYVGTNICISAEQVKRYLYFVDSIKR